MQNEVNIYVHASGKKSKLFSFAFSYAVQMSPTKPQERIWFCPQCISLSLGKAAGVNIRFRFNIHTSEMFMDIVENYFKTLISRQRICILC